jgi:hypothetical protein
MVRKAVRSAAAVTAVLTVVLLGRERVEAAADPSQNVDPTCAQGGAASEIAASLSPATSDEPAFAQLTSDACQATIEQEEPSFSLDPSAPDIAVHPSQAYCSSLGCPNKVWCESKHYKKTITCELQACGDARCKPCPDWFGPLKNLVIKAWCSYVCKDGETVVGSSAYVITAWDPYQLCILP